MLIVKTQLHWDILFSFQTVHHNAYHDDPYAKEFGIKIDDKLASVEARILPPPWVYKLVFYAIAVCFVICHLAIST